MFDITRIIFSEIKKEQTIIDYYYKYYFITNKKFKKRNDSLRNIIQIKICVETRFRVDSKTKNKIEEKLLKQFKPNLMKVKTYYTKKKPLRRHKLKDIPEKCFNCKRQFNGHCWSDDGKRIIRRNYYLFYGVNTCCRER